MTPLSVLALAAAAAWLAVALRPSRPYLTRERIEAPSAADSDLGDVAVLIPARNEAATIERTLTALAAQGRGLSAVVVDDRSADSTRERCAELGRALAGRLELAIVDGEPLPPAWSGKLWALEQGLVRVDRPRTLLLDADIELAPGLVPALVEHARSSGSALVSVMAELRCESAWERLLVPPFVYFFKLIYPFARVNDPRAATAAAAGGCMLIDTDVLRGIGGLESIRTALIDDCRLAAVVKGRGHRIWLGLSHSVLSRRPYPSLGEFTRMVTRTAFTQLGYSTALLLAVTLLMSVMFVLPVAGLFALAQPLAVAASVLALILMGLTYLPVVRFYGRPAVWVLTLPVAASLFLGMTWMSALNYWRGIRAEWKDRSYAPQ